MTVMPVLHRFRPSLPRKHGLRPVQRRDQLIELSTITLDLHRKGGSLTVIPRPSLSS